MSVKSVVITSAALSGYWYSNKIGRVYEASVYDKVSYRLYINGIAHYINKSDCRPLKKGEARKPAPNSSSHKCPHCGKNIIVAVTSGN